MNTPRDYYEVMGVARDASQDEIKKAYRRKAMRYHPDRNPNDREAEEKLKEVNEANEVLSDPEKRSLYDRFGHDGPRAGAAAGGGFHHANVDLGEVFGDIFGDMFGGGGGRRHRRQAQGGRDIHLNLEIGLEEAVGGGAHKVRVPTRVQCETCEGSGSRDGKAPVPCPHCEGTGQVGSQMGFFSVRQTCQRCGGAGQVIADPCGRCAGQGLVTSERSLELDIPRGVDEGSQLRLSGKGEEGRGGQPAGDLYVAIRVRPHPLFERHEDDLYCEVPVDLATMTLGGEQEIPTLEGPVKIKIPAGTQSGKQLRLRGKGVRGLRSGRQGDLFCRVLLETPVKLNREQRELLKKLQASMNRDKQLPRGTAWLHKARDFFDGVRDGWK